MRSPFITKLCAAAMLWSLSAYISIGSSEAQECACNQSMAGSSNCGCSTGATDCGCSAAQTNAPAGTLGCGCEDCAGAGVGQCKGCKFCVKRKRKPMLAPGPATGMSFFSKGRACQTCDSGGFLSRLAPRRQMCSECSTCDSGCDACESTGCRKCGLFDRIASRRAAFATCPSGDCGSCPTCVRNGMLVDMQAQRQARRACGNPSCDGCETCSGGTSTRGLLSGLFFRKSNAGACDGPNCSGCDTCSSGTNAGGLLSGFGRGSRGAAACDGPNCSGCETCSVGTNAGGLLSRLGRGSRGATAYGDPNCSDCDAVGGGMMGGPAMMNGRGIVAGRGMGGRMIGGLSMGRGINTCSGADCSGCATCRRGGIFARLGSGVGRCNDATCGGTDCETCGAARRALFGRGCGVGGCGLGGRLCGRCNKLVAGEIPHKAEPPYPGFGAQAPTYAYPYYTTRGPRDFLQDACGPPMILPYSPRTSCLPSIGY
jgi:hypothetical protein